MKTVKKSTIKINMSFLYAVNICITSLEDGAEEGKKIAREELRKYGAALDLLKKQGHIK